METPEQFITKAYLEILCRPPDAAGLKGFVSRISTGKLKKENLSEELKNSEEYRLLPTLKIDALGQKSTRPVIKNIDTTNNGRKVAFIMENFSFYSGGRYLSYMIAIAFQEIGFDVTLYTDKKPSEIPYIHNDDFNDYKKPRIEYTPDLDKLSFSRQSYDLYVGAPTDGCVVAHREAIKNNKPYIAFLFDVPPFMKKYSKDLECILSWVFYNL